MGLPLFVSLVGRDYKRSVANKGAARPLTHAAGLSPAPF